MPAACTSSSAISVSRGPTRSPAWPSGVAARSPTPAAMPMPSPTRAGGSPAERVRNSAQAVNQAPLPMLVTSVPRQRRRSTLVMTVHRTLKCAMTLQPEEKRQRYDPRIDLLKELADPVRLRVIDHLGNVGPATVSELAAGLRVTMPQLSNHLRRLRDAGLVHVERTGRHAIYA